MFLNKAPNDNSIYVKNKNVVGVQIIMHSTMHIQTAALGGYSDIQ